MTTQPQSSSKHLGAARELLDQLEPVVSNPHGDHQTKAMAAAAHSILVLAEQVAVVRVLMAGDAAQRMNGGSPASQGMDGQPGSHGTHHQPGVDEATAQHQVPQA